MQISENLYKKIKLNNTGTNFILQNINYSFNIYSKNYKKYINTDKSLKAIQNIIFFKNILNFKSDFINKNSNTNNLDIFFDIIPNYKKLDNLDYSLFFNKKINNNKNFTKLLNSTDLILPEYAFSNKKNEYFNFMEKYNSIIKKKIIDLQSINSINIDWSSFLNFNSRHIVNTALFKKKKKILKIKFFFIFKKKI